MIKIAIQHLRTILAGDIMVCDGHLPQEDFGIVSDRYEFRTHWNSNVKAHCNWIGKKIFVCNFIHV
jgi:hypothetical protein